MSDNSILLPLIVVFVGTGIALWISRWLGHEGENETTKQKSKKSSPCLTVQHRQKRHCENSRTAPARCAHRRRKRPARSP